MHPNFLHGSSKWSISPTRVVLLLALLFSTSNTLWAEDAKLAAQKQSQIEAAISKFMAANSVPGVSAAVVESGEFVWSAGFGMADLENFVPVTSHTLFRLASVSKPITAVAAMQLWQRGKLDLDAPVQKYCPAFPQKERPITTRELLGHLAGIRHYRSDSPDDPEVSNAKHFDNPIQAGLDFFKNDPLVEKPGTKFHYSTQGFTVVGCAIEGASGEKYTDFVRENVFGPAAMTNTYVDDHNAIIPNRASFYKKDKSGTVQNADFLDPIYKIPGGGWLSSAEDMARFEVAILNDTLVQRATRNLMLTPQTLADGSHDEYGLGWFIGKDQESGTVGHAGGQQGTSTSIQIAPDRRSAVVVLINMDSVDASGLASQLLKIILANN